MTFRPSHLLAMVLVLHVLAPLQAQTNFVKSSANPVVPAWSGDPDDPSGYQTTHSPTIVYDSALALYRMWFISQSVHGTRTVVSSAISFDAENWHVSAKNPVLRTGQPGSFDEQILAPRVIRDGNQYLLYYTGVTAATRKVGLARSINGVQWTKEVDNPVLSPGPLGAWDSQMIGWCSVLKVDTMFYMWYNGTTSGQWEGIGLATSRDGVHWTKYAGNPVFVKGTAGWDSYEVATPTVIRKDDLFYMFYEGQAAPGPYSFGWAYSSDGVHWTRGTPNPVLQHGIGWEALLGTGEAMLHNNKIYLWYSGLSPLTGQWQIGLAIGDFSGTSTAVFNSSLPTEFALSHPFPNPFNPAATVRYQVPTTALVTMTVHDMLGRQVSTLVDEVMPPGIYSVTVDASQLSSGTYFVRLQSNSFIASQKLVLLK